MRPFISLSSDSFLKDSMSFWCFVFFRCLIYKVQARPLSHTRRSFIITPRRPLVKPFFHFPQNFFCFQLPGPHPSLALANFVILPRFRRVVKSFFRLRQNFFCLDWKPLALALALRYYTKSFPCLSTLFSHFSVLFFSSFCNHKICRFSAHDTTIYPPRRGRPASAGPATRTPPPRSSRAEPPQPR